MATPRKWSNVQVAVQSALATAVTMNTVSKANPGVVGYTGTDPTSGDYIAVTANGMFQIDGRVFRVANVVGGSNTLELEGENTTDYETFSSGSFQVITFGTSITSLVSLSATGGDPSFIPTTTIHDNVARQIPGIPSPISFSFESIWDPSDAGLIALKAASDASAKRAIRFTFADGAKLVFNSYVACTNLPIGEAQGLVRTQITMSLDGRPTVFAS